MEWLEDKKLITQKYFTAINQANIELFRRIKEKFDDTQPIFPIVEFILDRIHTVTILIEAEKLWDAEIVLRAATESLIKLIFITSADESEQKERIREFWYDLAEVNQIKQSEQAKTNLKVLESDQINVLAFSPIILTPEEEENLRKKWNKTARKKLEQKWSFSEIILSLSENYKGGSVETFKALLHSYRSASHVAHGDETGILIIKERAGRSETERNIADFAHYLRLMGDCFTYSILISGATMDFLKLDKTFFNDLFTSLSGIRDLSDTYLLKLYDDELYDKYRNTERQ